MSDRLSGIYRDSPGTRRERVAEAIGLTVDDFQVLTTSGLSIEKADQMVENALGIMGLPFSVCTHLVLDGRPRVVPMVIEEPSVVAAASKACKMLAQGGGVRSEATPPLMIGQVQLLDVPCPERAAKALTANTDRLLHLANSKHLRLRAAGGGAVGIEVRSLPKLAADDPVGDMLIVEIVVDVRDAMGANAVNSMCETIAPSAAELTGGRARLRILSNLSDRRRVTVSGLVPFAALERKGGPSGQEVARGIEEASVFAERDPYRAATGNKGIMNGVDGVLLAFGQDWRAVEAGAHSYAARSGRYTSLSKWRVGSEGLEGTLEMPLAVGTVGGVVNVHPTVSLAMSIAEIDGAMDLSRCVAAVGFAQNLAALRALASEGIQAGHMRMHGRNIAVEAGAEGEEVAHVADCMSEKGSFTLQTAKETLAELRRRPRTYAS